MKETVISIPMSCICCGYPKQFGAKIYAEIKLNQKEEITRSEWRCPVCGAKKTIEVSAQLAEETKVSRHIIQSAPRRPTELLPGKVGPMQSED